jgi:peptidoglycan hydrolase-like protein with peptidoglycan-binding domain
LRAAARWGLYWLGFGGSACDNPSKPASAVFRDAMHFEFHGTPAEARSIAAHNAAIARPAWIPDPSAPAAPPPTTTTTTTTVSSGPPLPVPLQRGSRGTPVKTLQSNLNTRGQQILVDGIFGLQTQGAVKRVQPAVGRPATGVVDAATAKALGFTPVIALPVPLVFPVRIGSRGTTVSAVQAALNRRGENLAVDGIFGKLTDAAVRRAQTALKLPVTGVVDLATASALGLR